MKQTQNVLHSNLNTSQQIQHAMHHVTLHITCNYLVGAYTEYPPKPQIIKLGMGGNGTAGTAMAAPLFEGEKWRRLDFNLHMRYRMSSLSGSL